MVLLNMLMVCCISMYTILSLLNVLGSCLSPVILMTDVSCKNVKMMSLGYVLKLD